MRDAQYGNNQHTEGFANGEKQKTQDDLADETRMAVQEIQKSRGTMCLLKTQSDLAEEISTQRGVDIMSTPKIRWS